jgi:hypothetical protein
LAGLSRFPSKRARKADPYEADFITEFTRKSL